MMVRKRFSLAFAAPFLLLGLLAACSQPGSPEGGKSASPPPAPLSVCLLGVAGIPVAVAQEHGLFARHGVAVTLIKSASGTQAMESLYKGECDLATPSETVVMLQSFARQDFSILATIGTSDDSLRLLANRQRGIHGPQDLKGKRIFAPKGSVSHFFLDTFLARHGLTAAEVEVVSGGVPDVVAALRKGEIDAFCQTDVMVNPALRALGGDALVMTLPGLCRTSFNLATSKRLLAEQPETLRKFLAALLENEEIMAQGITEPARAAFRNLAIAEESMAEIFANYHWKVGLEQVLLLSLEQEARWAMESGLVRNTALPNYLDFIQTDLLRSLRPEAITVLR